VTAEQHADTVRRKSSDEQARLRAMSQLGHFGSSTGGASQTFCDRCGKPLNRWDEKCEYQPTAAHLLAEDVLALLAENQRLWVERKSDEEDVAVIAQYADEALRGGDAT
jgi:hypothetical protein